MVATEIIPNLWLGDIRSALDTEFLRRNRIGTIINCTTKHPFTKENVEKIRIELRDRGTEDDFNTMYICLVRFVPELYKMLRSRKRVYVHCYAGCQRSVTIIIGFLIKYTDMTLQEIIDTLQSKWDRVGLNFLSSITRYYIAQRDTSDLGFEYCADTTE